MEASLSGLTGRQRRRLVRSGRLHRPGGWRPGSRAGVLHGLEAQLPAAPVSAGTARHLARQLLTDCGLAALTDDVLLVTSELAANAITASKDRHPAAIAVWLARTPDGLFVAVADPAAADRLPWLPRLAPIGPAPSTGSSGARPEPAELGELAEHGRGLTLAAALADRVGWYRAGKWTVVWAEFRLTGDAPRPDDASGAQDTADAGDRPGSPAYAA